MTEQVEYKAIKIEDQFPFKIEYHKDGRYDIQYGKSPTLMLIAYAMARDAIKEILQQDDLKKKKKIKPIMSSENKTKHLNASYLLEKITNDVAFYVYEKAVNELNTQNKIEDEAETEKRANKIGIVIPK